MDAQTVAVVVAGGGALGVVVWVLAKVGKALVTIAEALAAAAVVFFVVWLAIKAVVWALRQTVTHWRTSLTVVALLAWWHWWGWASLAITGAGVVAVLTGWRLVELRSFDAWAGRHLRAWWLRWTVYAPKLPDWLHACGLGVKQDAAPIVLAVTPFGRSPGPQPAQGAGPAAHSPRGALGCVLGSGPGAVGARPETGRLRRRRPGTGFGPGGGPLPDIPGALLSSGSLLILLGVVVPGDVLVVEPAGFEAAVQDPDESVAELAQRGVVAGAAGADGVVVGPSAG